MTTFALHPYLTYKASGVPWLGDMPEHWEVRRGGWLFRKMDRPVRDADEVVTCFRDGTVTLRKNRRTEGFTESLKEIGYQGVRRGDLVIHQMDAFAGAVGVSDSDGKGTPVYSVCHSSQHADSFYYAHIVREMARNQWILALAKGIRERSTDFRYSEFAKQALPLPPLPEQAAIVRYLDHADRRIRHYINAKRKLIPLLEEEKQAIINQAVTRGLDPNVPLKPSGVEWLGDVPEHWERRRLKTILQPVDRRSTSGGETLLSLRRDYGVVVYAEHFVRPSQSRSLVGFKLVSVGQLVLNRLQANNGLVFNSTLDGLVSPDYSVFQEKSPLQMQFLSDLLRTSSYRAYFRQNATGLGTGTAGFLRLYDDTFLETPVYLPSLSEQAAIVEHLDKTPAEMDAAIARTHRQIELMQEYRTRLIADVVTGKLDVREAAAQLPDESDDQDQLQEGGPLGDGMYEDLHAPGEFAEELAMPSNMP